MPNIDQYPRDENGREHGEFIHCFGNGQLRYRWNYVHGIPHGLWEGYNTKGRIEYRGNYNMNRKIGYWIKYSYRLKCKKEYNLCLI